MPKAETSGHRDRVKKAFLAGDPAATSDEALLELLLYQIVPIQDVKPRRDALIEKHGTLAGVLGGQGEWPAKLRTAADLIQRLAAALPSNGTSEAPHPALFDAADLLADTGIAPNAVR